MAEAGTPAWHEAGDILCVRLDGAGDLLMTTPAIRALKEQKPGRRITLMTSGAAAQAASLIPLIDEVIVYNAPWVKSPAPRQDTLTEDAMLEFLRASHLQAAVIFTVYSQSPLPAALLCCLGNIPLRLAHCHENPYQLLTHWVPDPEPAGLIRHEVRRQLDLVSMVGAFPSTERLCLSVPDALKTSVPSLLEKCGVEPGRPWLLIHPGATAASRRYPSAGFAAAARRLAQEGGYQILFTGSEDEQELISTIQQGMGAASASGAGKLSFAELCALIGAAPVILTNNTAPAHLAAALGTPVVDLYALTNPQHSPWRVPHRLLYHNVPCRWCYKSTCPEIHNNCLHKVRPDEVAEAVMDLLKGQPTDDHAWHQCGVS